LKGATFPAFVAGVVGLFWSISSGLWIYDEAWFLRVVLRVVAGDVLYHDVFFGANPLSVQLSAAFFGFAGADLAALRALLVGCFGLTIVAAQAAAHRVTEAADAWRWPLALGLLVLSPPGAGGAGAAYTPLANMLLLATLAETLREEQGRLGRSAWSAGACAGLAFAAKQNVGVLAFAAFAASALILRRPVRFIVRGMIAAGAAAMVALAPVAASGGLEALFDYGYLGKGAYLRSAGTPLLGLAWLADEGFRGVTLYPGRLLMAVGLVLPPASALALGCALRRSEGIGRRRLVATAVFALAALLGLVPRADYVHLVSALPASLVLLVSALGLGQSGELGAVRRRAVVLLSVALGLMVAIRSVRAGQQLLFDDDTSRLAPSLRGARLPAPQLQDVEQRTRALKELIPPGGSAFVVTGDAPLLYLTSGIRNPTPWDTPFMTTFGIRGQPGVLATLESAGVTVVLGPCEARYAPLWPHDLERRIRSRWVLVETRGPLALFRPPRIGPNGV
jgi:hypothetical protein